MFKKENLLIFIPIILLLSINILLLYICEDHKNIYIFKTVISILIGIILIFLINNISLKYLKFFIFIGYFISLILLIYVNIFECKIKGSKRWIKIFENLQFQPSELTKIFNPLILSYLINNNNKYINKIKFIYILLFIIIIPSFLIFIQPDFGSSILVIFSGFILLFISNIHIKKLFLILLNLLLLFIISLFFMKDYQKKRIYSLYYYYKDPYGIGYNIIQSKIAIGSGGFLGKGIFKGTQSLLKFIPEYHTDFVFSVFAEKFGFLGVIFLLLIYLILIINIIFISINNSNNFSRLVILNYIIDFFINIFINISMVIGIIPVVGIPLPLLSYGGTFIVVFFIKIGIILLVNKFTYLTKI